MFDDPTDPTAFGTDDATTREQLQGLLGQLNDMDGVRAMGFGIEADDLPFDPDDPEAANEWLTERVTLEVEAPRSTHVLFASVLGGTLYEHGDLSEASWEAWQFSQEWADVLDAEAVSVGMCVAEDSPDDHDAFEDIRVELADGDDDSDDDTDEPGVKDDGLTQVVDDDAA